MNELDMLKNELEILKEEIVEVKEELRRYELLLQELRSKVNYGNEFYNRLP